MTATEEILGIEEDSKTEEVEETSSQEEKLEETPTTEKAPDQAPDETPEIVAESPEDVKKLEEKDEIFVPKEAQIQETEPEKKIPEIPEVQQVEEIQNALETSTEEIEKEDSFFGVQKPEEDSGDVLSLFSLTFPLSLIFP